MYIHMQYVEPRELGASRIYIASALDFLEPISMIDACKQSRCRYSRHGCISRNMLEWQRFVVNPNLAAPFKDVELATLSLQPASKEAFLASCYKRFASGFLCTALPERFLVSSQELAKPSANCTQEHGDHWRGAEFYGQLGSHSG